MACWAEMVLGEGEMRQLARGKTIFLTSDRKMTQKLEKNHLPVSLHFIFCSDVLLLSCTASQELNLKEQCFANCSAWHDCNMQSIMHNMHPIIPFIIIVSWLRARE